MKNIKNYVRKDLKDFKPYYAQLNSYKVKLDANESPFNLPPKVKKNIIKWFKEEENLNIYPDTDSLELRKELASFWNLKTDNILCGSGSDQIIEYICRTFLEPDDIVIVPSPSFSMYALTTKLNRGKVINVDFDKNFTYNVDNIIKKCKENNPKLLFICNPNNPTGTIMKCKDIERILNEIDCPFILDEAYSEFSNCTMISKIKQYPNMIILRTLSKAYSLAGIRMGYAIGDKSFIKAIETVKTPYNLNTLTQKIALEMIKVNLYAMKNIEYINNERQWMSKKLKEIKYIKIYPSHANFIYVESKINLSLKLKEKGILIRDFGVKNGIYSSRITIGSREQNKKILKALKSGDEKIGKKI